METRPPIIFGMVTTSRSHPYTHAALASFFRWTTLQEKDRFFLIDNNGDFKPQNQYPIDRISNPQPLGFSANANQAIGYALENRADLLFLNNDLIFAKNWLEPLVSVTDSIVSPLCNRDVHYANSTVIPKTSHVAHTFSLRTVMELRDYIGNEACFDAIVEAHQRGTDGHYATLNVPFFCIRIPYRILSAVGRFDEAFGNGGGEDYDYALRTYLAGYQVQVALRSFVLHFQGRSSWAGGESQAEQLKREEQFFKRFIDKWGQDLFELILREKVDILKKAPPIQEQNRAESLRQVVVALKGALSPQIKI